MVSSRRVLLATRSGALRVPGVRTGPPPQRSRPPAPVPSPDRDARRRARRQAAAPIPRRRRRLLSATPRSARSRSRPQKVRAVFHQPRRPPPALEAEGIQERRGQPLDLVPAIVPPTLPLPFSLRVDDAATTARLNERSTKVSGAASGTVDVTTATDDDHLRSRNRRRTAGAEVVHARAGDLRRAVQRAGAAGHTGAQSDRRVGPWPRRRHRADASRDRSSRRTTSTRPQAIYQPPTATSSAWPQPSLGRAHGARRPVPVGGRRRSLLHQRRAPAAGAAAARVRAGRDPVDDDTRRSSATTWRTAVRFPAPPQNVRFFFGPKQLDVLRAVDPEFTRAIYFGMFAWLAAPLLDALQVGARLHRQLGLVDHRPDDPHQPRDVPAAAQERRLDAAGCRSCSRR